MQGTGRGVLNRHFMLLVFLLVLLTFVSLFVGRYQLTIFGGDQTDVQLAWNLTLNLRLPRVLMAVLTGAVLAGSGAVLQMVFRNPLVDAGFLGVSPGAAFGAAVGIIFLGGSAVAVQSAAAAFAFLALGTTYLLATRIRTGDWVLRLILAGIAVSALLSAGTSVMKYLADPLRQLPDIVFWMMGGLWAITLVDLYQIAPVALTGLLVMFLMRWRLNLLSLHDDTAFSLGISTTRERLVILIAAVSATAVVVAKTGVVGWVGLIMPHIARRLIGAEARAALPTAMLIGAIFTLLCDDLARTLTTGEIPLGIITSIAGAAFFITLLTSGRIQVRR